MVSTLVGLPHFLNKLTQSNRDNINCNVCFTNASAFLSHNDNIMSDLSNTTVYTMFIVNLDYLQIAHAPD